MTHRGVAITACLAALATGLAALFQPTPKLIWNASASVPIGLYAMRPAGALHVTELVVVKAPEPLARFLADRGYLPKDVPLLKHILALPGQVVCRTDRTITVDGIAMGEARTRSARSGPPRVAGLPCRSGRRSLSDEPAVQGLSG